MVQTKVVHSAPPQTHTLLKGDLPHQIIKEFASELSYPLAHIYNESLEKGEFPTPWKKEVVSPTPKVFPPETENDLRKISGTPFFSKTFERFLVSWIQDDTSANKDPAAYGGVKGMSTAHYLVKLVHDILQGLDNNSHGEKAAAVAVFYDWRKAFDMQDHTLGIKAFLDCGVRNSLVPVLVNYLKGRTMTVKFKDAISSEHNLPGGGAQGTLLGPEEYSCQSNNSADCVNQARRYKFVDDLTTLEILKVPEKVLSYNFKNHVASDIGEHNQFVPETELESTEFIKKIDSWTTNQKMALNAKKTKYMMVNFCDNYQFNTRIHLNNSVLDYVNHFRLLGIELTNDLTWRKNTAVMTKKAFARMSLLTKLVHFGVPDTDLVLIYVLYIRSLLEYCAVLWHSTITEEEVNDLERVQKCAAKVILQHRYTTYDEALENLGLTKLTDRRDLICLQFAKSCLKNEKTKSWFPVNHAHEHDIRTREKYQVEYANTERFRQSTLIYLQRLLNQNV